jgi:hypothetical protein
VKNIWDKGKGNTREDYNGGLVNLYSSSDVTRFVISWRMRWDGQGLWHVGR